MDRPLCKLWLALAGVLVSILPGCERQLDYGREKLRNLGSARPQVWAVAPVLNLSGERAVDPILQADLVYHQLQSVGGLTVLPVNKVVETYVALRIEKVASAQQAALVCDVLGVDGLIVPTVTIYDPYNPPKFGGAVTLFLKPRGYKRPAGTDVRELVIRLSRPGNDPAASADVVQKVGMFDASNGTVRDRLFAYAKGRNDPIGPLGVKEYLVHMDRYCGFAYSELIGGLIESTTVRSY